MKGVLKKAAFGWKIDKFSYFANLPYRRYSIQRRWKRVVYLRVVEVRSLWSVNSGHSWPFFFRRGKTRVCIFDPRNFQNKELTEFANVILTKCRELVHSCTFFFFHSLVYTYVLRTTYKADMNMASINALLRRTVYVLISVVARRLF